MPCDAACMKIIINGRFMAALAPALAARYGTHHRVGASAMKLAQAVDIQNQMLKAMGLDVHESEGFGGCEQAKLLVHWLTDGPTPDASDRMDTWTAKIWRRIADLAAGKTPGAESMDDEYDDLPPQPKP